MTKFSMFHVDNIDIRPLTAERPRSVRTIIGRRVHPWAAVVSVFCRLIGRRVVFDSGARLLLNTLCGTVFAKTSRLKSIQGDAPCCAVYVVLLVSRVYCWLKLALWVTWAWRFITFHHLWVEDSILRCIANEFILQVVVCILYGCDTWSKIIGVRFRFCCNVRGWARLFFGQIVFHLVLRIERLGAVHSTFVGSSTGRIVMFG